MSKMKESKLKNMQKKEDDIIIRSIYRPVSERIALLISKTGITPNQVTFISVLIALCSGIFFALGNWNYLLLAFLFLQLTTLCDCIDGNLARYTGKGTVLGEWYDLIANKLHKFFFLLGASIGVFRMTNDPFYLILGSISIFSWHFTAYVNEMAKRMFMDKKSRTSLIVKGVRIPVNWLAMNLLGLAALLNKVSYALWFFSIFIPIWAIVKIWKIHKKWAIRDV